MYILTISFIENEITHYVVGPKLDRLLTGLGDLQNAIRDYNGDIGVKIEKEIGPNNLLVLDGFICSNYSFETIKDSLLELSLKE